MDEAEHDVLAYMAFDESLRARDPAWGIRHLGDVAREASGAGLQLREQIAMPANNLLLVFERAKPVRQQMPGAPT